MVYWNATSFVKSGQSIGFYAAAWLLIFISSKFLLVFIAGMSIGHIRGSQLFLFMVSFCLPIAHKLKGKSTKNKINKK